jgi:hypothetical protein
MRVLSLIARHCVPAFARKEHSTGSPCIYVNKGSIYVHRPHSRDLTLNFYVVWVIEAKLFNNPNDGDSIIN